MRSLGQIAALLVALPAGALDIEYVAVRDSGNPADTAIHCLNEASDCGSVAYDYAIARYEITNAQYAEFLNAVAASDPLGLYHGSMDSDATAGGIARSGSDGSYAYAAKAGFESKPVTYVSLWDALRFANWLNNGQGSAATETGAYTLTPDGIANNTITRNGGAIVFVPSENEWYKAAYYSPGGTFFDYPTGTNAEPGCVAPASDTGNSANCDLAVNALTDVGAYGLSVSAYRTFDQGGNVAEWSDEISGFSADQRGFRGGGWDFEVGRLAAASATDLVPTTESHNLGFRVARTVPEPARMLLVLTGGLVLVAARRARRAGSLPPGHPAEAAGHPAAG